MNNENLRIDDHSTSNPLTDIIQKINIRFNNKLNEGHENGLVIEHNLEYGLGAENIFRELLREVLPLKYGIGKGKIININGNLSSHQDVIIYDRMNYPTLFIDENKNLILPLESVYFVIEIKVKTNSDVLKKAFEGLESVSKLNIEDKVHSSNELVDYRPPGLIIFSFQDDKSLATIKDNYYKLSKEFSVNKSFSRYSKKSPGHNRDTTINYLVKEINILNKGEVFAMLSGNIGIGEWAENTFGMFISGLLSNLNDIKLDSFHPTSYVHWLGAGKREIYTIDS